MKKYFSSKTNFFIDKINKLKRNKAKDIETIQTFDDSNYRIVYASRVYDEEKIYHLTSQNEFKLISPERNNQNDLEKNKNKRLIIWSLVKESAISSTMHGLPNVFRLENKFLKLMWIVCFLGALIYCIYTIASIIKTFLLFEVLTNQQVSNTSPVDFPAITVCNINPFDRRHAQSYINMVLTNNNLSYVNDITKIDINPKLVSNLIKASIKSDPSLNVTQIQNLGFDLNYMILTCYFNNLPCNSSDFIWRYDYDYTNCFTFNSGYDKYGNKVPIKQSNEAGPDGALKLELFLGDDDYQNQFILNSGAHIVVHNQSLAPIIVSEGVDIATGFQTNIGIRRSFLSK